MEAWLWIVGIVLVFGAFIALLADSPTHGIGGSFWGRWAFGIAATLALFVVIPLVLTA